MGLDRLGVGLHQPQLGAHALDVAVDAALVTGVAGNAQRIEQLFATEDPLRLLQQTLQQAVLMPGQTQRLAAISDQHTLTVHQEQRTGGLDPRSRGHALENRPHPRRHFPWAERFDHVVVGTDFQADDSIDLAIAGAEEHHRHFAEPAQLLAGFKTADVRQADVENDQVGGRCLLMLKGG